MASCRLAVRAGFAEERDRSRVVLVGRATARSRATDRVAGADTGVNSQTRRGDVTAVGETRYGGLEVLLSLADIAANLSV